MKAAPLAVPALAEKDSRLEEWIVPVEGNQLSFCTAGTARQDVTLKPLKESRQRFSVYFRVTS